MEPVVRPAGPSDREAIVDVTVAAFVTEPAVDYFFADGYGEYTPPFFGFLLDLRLRSGQVWVAEHEGEVAAVAMWDVPGGASEGEFASTEWDVVAQQFPDDVNQRLDTYEEFLAATKPTEDHFYLGVVATHPKHHGVGLGTAVLAPTLAEADSAGLPAYLETGTEANVGYYARHGFVVDAEVDLPDGPRIWWMRRPARAT